MTEWKKIRLGDIVKTNQSTYSPKEKWEYVNYLDTGNLIMNKIDSIQHIDLLKEKLPSRAKRKVKHNSILYSTVRPNQLHYGIIKEQPKNFLVSTGFVVVDVDFTVANPNFIYYILTQREITEHLQAIGEQSVSAYPSIRPFDIENLEIYLPSLEEQDKIVSILSTIDRKLRNNSAINNNLFQQAQAIYKSWFIDFEPFDYVMPSNWSVGKVADIIELHDSKRIPLSSRERAERQGIYPYYGATSIMDYVDDYLFDGIYLLLAEDGTVSDANGYPILQYVDGKFWVNNHAHIITGKHNFSVELLYTLFSLTNVQSIITGAVQPKISQQNLKNVQIIIPDDKSILEIDSIIQPFFAEIRNRKSEIKSLTELRDSLLPKLMSGEIDVSDIEL